MSFQVSAVARSHPSVTHQITFNTRLGQYNKQLSKNNKQMNRLIANLKIEHTKPIGDLNEITYTDICFEIEEMYAMNRRLLNLKRKLYLKNNMHWDEEFY